jgi:hypothetical protein
LERFVCRWLAAIRATHFLGKIASGLPKRHTRRRDRNHLVESWFDDAGDMEMMKPSPEIQPGWSYNPSRCLGREKAGVFTLNLRNRLIFKAADEEGAVESADVLGKKARD